MTTYDALLPYAYLAVGAWALVSLGSLALVVIGWLMHRRTARS